MAGCDGLGEHDGPLGETAAKFVFRLHAEVFSQTSAHGDCYPMNDGAYLVSWGRKKLDAVMEPVMSQIASRCINNTKPLHRSVVRGGIAFGSRSHGNAVGHSGL